MPIPLKQFFYPVRMLIPALVFHRAKYILFVGKTLHSGLQPPSESEIGSNDTSPFVCGLTLKMSQQKKVKALDLEGIRTCEIIRMLLSVSKLLGTPTIANPHPSGHGVETDKEVLGSVLVCWISSTTNYCPPNEQRRSNFRTASHIQAETMISCPASLYS